jgi:hypothetical protein
LRVTGEYEVVGRREYRGHKPGTVFEASIESNAAGRAIQRGDLALLRISTPELQPGSYLLPDGWLNEQGRE